MSNEAPTPTPEDKAKYDAAKKELLHALTRKRNADKNLAQIEVQIYNLEGSYLTETALQSGGNIVQGFEGYLKNAPGGRRKYEVSETDRMFSSSSATYKKALELSGEGEESGATGDDTSRGPTPGLTTVVVPPAKQDAAQQKKQRDREYQRKKRANLSAARRSAQSDDESVASATSNRRPTKRARMADDD